MKTFRLVSNGQTRLTLLALLAQSATAQAGSVTLQEITRVDQVFTSANARNTGSCLAEVAAGTQPRRWLVGAAGSNSASGSSRVGRSLPVEIEAGGGWNPLPSQVSGSPTGDVGTGYFAYRCAAFGVRHVVSQLGFPRAHVYRDGVVEQTLIPALVGASSNLAPDVSVSIGGDLVALGVPYDNGNRGRVHVWQLNGTNWQLLQVLDSGAGAVVGGQFGGAVALYGNMLLVGAPAETTTGRVYVWELAGGMFQSRGTLALPNNIDTAVEARFGASIGIDEADGSALFVGAPGAKLTQLNRRTGTAVAYINNPASAARWDLRYALAPLDFATSAVFGSTLRLRSRVLIVSDPAHPAPGSTGAVYRYSFNGDLGLMESAQKFYRLAGASDSFGWSLGFQDDSVVIGAPGAFSLNPINGNVYQMGVDRLLSNGFE